MGFCLNLPMFFFELKQSNQQPNFSSSFQNRIDLFYREDPKNFFNEIKEFETLRQCATKVSHDSKGLSLLKRYYIQLLIVSNKFKYAKGNCDIKFTWFDMFSKQNISGDIQLELDSILYNIGALHSELGASEQRSVSEKMKSSCNHFQCAAWVFKKLKENPYYVTEDLSKYVMSFRHLYMLAQAQECVLEKSIFDDRQPQIIAKVGAEVVKYYDTLYEYSAQFELMNKDPLFEVLGNKLSKDCKRSIEFKISFYKVICAYYMGNIKDLKIGERIAWLMFADEKLKLTFKLAKSLNQPYIIDLINFLSDLIEKNLEQAKKDNDFIYHEAILPQDKLVFIKGVSLIKETSFNTSDPELSGKDIFSRLIPIEAFETVSLYSENRDQMWRDIKSKLEEKNEELVKFLSIIQLDKESVRKRKFHVPENLVSICASLSLNPELLEDVKNKLEKLEEKCNEVDILFKNLEKKFNQENENNHKHQNLIKKSNDYKIFEDCLDEFDKHYDVHKSAKLSNQDLRNTIEKYEKDIDLLTHCSVQDLEELFTASADDLLIDKSNLDELEKLFDKVEEMQQQREKLENQLQKSIMEDNILRKVVVNTDQEIDQVFEKELKKFDIHINYLELNMKAQDNILNALTRANADYVDTRKAFMKIEQLRQEKIDSFFEAYENFQGVIINLDKGLEFYNQLTDILNKIEEKVKHYIESSQSRRDLELKESQKFSGHENNLNKNTNFSNSSNNPNQPKLKDYLSYMNQSNINQPTQPNNSFYADSWKTYGVSYDFPNTYLSSTQNSNSVPGYHANIPATNVNNYSNLSNLYPKNNLHTAPDQAYNYYNYNTNHFPNNNLQYQSNIPMVTNQNQIYNQYSVQLEQKVPQNLPKMNVNTNPNLNYSYNQQILSSNYVQPSPSSSQYANYSPVQAINKSIQQLNLSNPANYSNLNNSSVQDKPSAFKSNPNTFDNILNSSNDLDTQPILTPISVTEANKISNDANKKQSLV